MSTIIVYGDKRDTALSTIVRQKFSKIFAVHFYNGEEYVVHGTGKHLNLFEIDSIKNISIDNCLIVFKNKADTRKIQSISSNSLCIVDSENKKHLQFIQKKYLPAISCGMLQKDTFTFSSLNEESAVVCAQRSIQTVSKKTLEPFELPIKLQAKLDEYTILSYCALVTLFEIDTKTEFGFTTINYL